MMDQFDDFAAERDLSWEEVCVLPTTTTAC